MLPLPNDPNFPAAMKARREAIGMSRSELARAAGIHSVMPRRYEEPECGEFAQPRYETWLTLNKALGLSLPDQQKATNSARDISTQPNITPLTIAEAKSGLSSYLGVPESNIEIIVKY